MTKSAPSDHDALVALLWELKAAWLANSGKDILLTNLLLDRRELDQFLAEACETTDTEIRRIVGRIVAVRASLGPAQSTASASEMEPVTVSTAAAEPKGTPAAPAPAAVVPSIADSDVVLRIHGSNTVGEKLSPALLQTFLRSKGATDIVTVAGKGPDEKALIAKMPGAARPIAVEVFAHGSSTAFADLASGNTDLGQSSRRIKAEEVATLAEKHGDLSKPGSEHVIALDGLAIVVHPQNPVSRLEIEQIAAVFSGKVNDWAELGGEPGPIVLYARDDASGTWDTFKNLVLAPTGATLDASARSVRCRSSRRAFSR